MTFNPDEFDVLRRISKRPNSNQRTLAKELGFSLGKINYCLNALKDKGLVKMQNFVNNPSKINYVYVLTPRHISKNKTNNKFYEKKTQRV